MFDDILTTTTTTEDAWFEFTDVRLSIKFNGKDAKGRLYPKDELLNALKENFKNHNLYITASSLPIGSINVNTDDIIGYCISYKLIQGNDTIFLSGKCKQDLSNLSLSPCGWGDIDKNNVVSNYSIICVYPI